MNSIPAQIFLQVILILVNAFFAATELAVISLNPTRLRKLDEEGNKSAGKLLRLVEEPSGFLSTIQVGITMAGYLGSAFAAENFSGYLVNWIYNGLGFTAIPEGALNTVAIILITIILAYFTLVFGELVPKRIAMQKPFEVAKVACTVVSGLSVVMRPIIWFLSASTNLVLRVLRLKTEAEEETVTEDEIRMMVDLGGERGTIDADEKKWIQNVFRFDDLSVRELMTRRGELVALPADAQPEEVLGAIRESGLSRFPVYGEDLDEIVGILNTRDFLLNLKAESPRTLFQLLRPAYFVPETIKADHLFKDMQRQKLHIAVVVDEYGGTEGVVTMEDLLEEIVGNIYDEFDPAESPEIEQLEENLWRVSGSISIERLGQELGMRLPDDPDYDTLGGLVLRTLNAVPGDGTQCEVEVNGLCIRVEKIVDHRIEQVLVSKTAPKEG